jgi:acyl-CoA synthetase (AMP-forming)/AMP-acid ligase II
VNEVEDMHYPLTSLQKGLLFQALSTPVSGIDAGQVVGSLREEISVGAFEQAWRRVVVRHDALRTAFCCKNQAEPMLCVFDSVELPFEYEDWREIAADEQLRKLDAFCQQDRERGFGLDVALVLPTSVTTSRPKLVPLTHRNLCSSAKRFADTIRSG